MSEFKWIPFKAQQPPEGVEVLVYFQGDNDGYCIMCDLHVGAEVGYVATHWSYIPTPISELDTLRARVAELEAHNASWCEDCASGVVCATANGGSL